jgi:Ricin-type beta-trefoil lectin domain
MLVNQASQMCLDLQVNSEAEVVPGTLVQQFYCWTGYTSEQWNRSSGSRHYHFQVWTRIKGLCLDVRNRSSANGALLQVYSCKYYEDAQEFRFVDA